jgi:hypothetical protein
MGKLKNVITGYKPFEEKKKVITIDTGENQIQVYLIYIFIFLKSHSFFSWKTNNERVYFSSTSILFPWKNQSIYKISKEGKSIAVRNKKNHGQIVDQILLC